ncbi:MAG: hypothetical protein QG656_1742 [Candidatus Hydrogenedentes bacterium]|nr:hypothetical protein [Candidatus Hydrogenedentota bacterium]
MMRVADEARYRRQRAARTAASVWWLPMLLFGCMGAIAWAIRGTSGWGGIDGTVVPGMTWGLLWYYLCRRQGIDARGVPLWLGLGIAIGGEWGYGQYVSWIRGEFQAGEAIVPVAPWIGYAWFAICGIAWGATGGIALGWTLSGNGTKRRWLARAIVPVGIGYLAWLLVQACPSWFFPNYALGLYAGGLDRHLIRTVETNTQNFVVAAWWAGAMLVAAFQRDRATLTMGALIGGGFGIGFPLAAVWCLGYTYAPNYIDWWKMWELNAGFYLGLLYTAALYWTMRQADKAHDIEENRAGADPPSSPRERWQNVSLVLAAFLLLFILFFGASSNVGLLLGLYKEGDVDQYEWPAARIALFAPAAVSILGVAVFKIGRILRSPQLRGIEPSGLPERMADLMAVIAFVGAATIWPSKIGVLYALFFGLALFAYHRLNRHFDIAGLGG